MNKTSEIKNVFSALKTSSKSEKEMDGINNDEMCMLTYV